VRVRSPYSKIYLVPFTLLYIFVELYTIYACIPVEFFTFRVSKLREKGHKGGWGVPRPFYKKSKLYST
jgi:hypothetical protein